MFLNSVPAFPVEKLLSCMSQPLQPSKTMKGCNWSLITEAWHWLCWAVCSQLTEDKVIKSSLFEYAVIEIKDSLLAMCMLNDHQARKAALWNTPLSVSLLNTAFTAFTNSWASIFPSSVPLSAHDTEVLAWLLCISAWVQFQHYPLTRKYRLLKKDSLCATLSPQVSCSC